MHSHHCEEPDHELHSLALPLRRDCEEPSEQLDQLAAEEQVEAHEQHVVEPLAAPLPAERHQLHRLPRLQRHAEPGELEPETVTPRKTLQRANTCPAQYTYKDPPRVLAKTCPGAGLQSLEQNNKTCAGPYQFGPKGEDDRRCAVGDGADVRPRYWAARCTVARGGSDLLSRE